MEADKHKETANTSAVVSDNNSHDEEVGVVNKSKPLVRELRNRHMQMIAIGTLVLEICAGGQQICLLTLKGIGDPARTWTNPNAKMTSQADPSAPVCSSVVERLCEPVALHHC